MVATHPYNTWPLHAILFTAEAVKHWEQTPKFAISFPPLPTNFRTSVQLEGVDGKSGYPGSGRLGALCVDDGGGFTSSHITV